MGGAQRDPRVRRVLVATGTGPGVGKTVVVAALAVAAGCRVAVLKPAQTGVGPGERGDLDDLARFVGDGSGHGLRSSAYSQRRTDRRQSGQRNGARDP